MEEFSYGPQRMSSRKCTWTGPGSQACSLRCHGDLDYCRQHVVDSIKLMRLTCDAARKKGTGPFARTLLKAGSWLVKLAITTAATMAAEDTMRNWLVEDAPAVRTKKGGKKKGAKKKAGKKKAAKKAG